MEETTALDGEDEITLPAGTFTITAAAGPVPLNVGGVLHVTGAGAASTILTGPRPTFMHFFGANGSVIENLGLQGPDLAWRRRRANHGP